MSLSAVSINYLGLTTTNELIDCITTHQVNWAIIAVFNILLTFKKFANFLNVFNIIVARTCVETVYQFLVEHFENFLNVSILM